MGRKEGEHSSPDKLQRYEVVSRFPQQSVGSQWGVVKDNFNSYQLLSTCYVSGTVLSTVYTLSHLFSLTPYGTTIILILQMKKWRSQGTCPKSQKVAEQRVKEIYQTANPYPKPPYFEGIIDNI